MSECSDRILQALKQADLSYGELAKLTGISKSALQRYATGETKKIPIDSIEAIAKATNVSAQYLMGWDKSESETYIDDKFPSPNITEDYTTFPVIGDIAAGYNHIAIESWDGDKVDVPNSYLKGYSPQDFFVLCVKGDSMYPQYQDGDKVLILRQSTVNYSGDVGAVIYDDEISTLKKIEFVEDEDWLRLVPVNPNVPPILIAGEELKHCRIMGVPKLLIREM